nr:MAG: hypothetical protein H2Bulk34326_000004 [Leviviridae sp.]
MNLGHTRAEQSFTSSNGGPETVTPLGDWVWQWEKDIYPESGNSAMIEGFRLCRPYTRSVGKITYHGGNDIVNFIFSPTNKTRVRYPDGSYWGARALGSLPLVQLAGSNLINATLTKALNNLKSQDIHLGNFLAEGHKTIDMVANTANKIANQVIRFRSKYPGDWLKVVGTQIGGLQRNLWCTIPNAWLQLQYGWIPLLSDIVGAMMHLARRDRFEIPYVSAHATGNNNVVTNSQLSGAQGGVVKYAWLQKQQVRVFLVYRLRSPALAELSSLGLINPAEIIWETTRYSFVVDWFLPVSAWLSALTGDVGYDFVTGGFSNTTKMDATSSGGVTGADNSASRTYALSAPTFQGRMTVFSRSCYAASPVPGLYVKNPLSLVHMANAMALLQQAFR